MTKTNRYKLAGSFYNDKVIPTDCEECGLKMQEEVFQTVLFEEADKPSTKKYCCELCMLDFSKEYKNMPVYWVKIKA